MNQSKSSLSEYQNACLSLMGITPMVLREVHDTESQDSEAQSQVRAQSQASAEKPVPETPKVDAASAIARLRQAAGDPRTNAPDQTVTSPAQVNPTDTGSEAAPVSETASETASTTALTSAPVSAPESVNTSAREGLTPPQEAEALPASVDLSGKVLVQVSEDFARQPWFNDLLRALDLEDDQLYRASPSSTDVFAGQSLAFKEARTLVLGDGMVGLPQQLTVEHKRALWQFLCQSSL